MSRHKGNKNKTERQRYIEGFMDSNIPLEKEVIKEYVRLQKERRKLET